MSRTVTVSEIGTIAAVLRAAAFGCAILWSWALLATHGWGRLAHLWLGAGCALTALVRLLA